MIKSDNNVVRVEGSRFELLSDFMMIAHTLIEKGICPSREMLVHLCSMAAVTVEDMKKELIDNIDDMDDIGTALELLGMLKKDGVL